MQDGRTPRPAVWRCDAGAALDRCGGAQCSLGEAAITTSRGREPGEEPKMRISKLLLSYIAGVCLFGFALYFVPDVTTSQAAEQRAGLCVSNQNGGDLDCPIHVE